MRRVFSLFVVLLLAGCGSANVTYTLTFDTKDESRQHDLTVRSLNVIERRLGAMDEDLRDQQIQRSGDTVQLVLEVGSTAAARMLTEQLTEPFKLRVMRESPEAEAQVTVPGHGGFVEAGVTEKHLLWVDAQEDPSNGKGVVKLTFTPEGTRLMNEIFRANKRKAIGIFVRDRLVSKLNVLTDEAQDNILIRDIPSAELVRVFADDLNVGLHVTFTPVP